MWTFEVSATIAGAVSSTPEAVWQYWTDVEKWRDWDESLLSSTLFGPFKVGTRGELTPHGMSAMHFELTEVTLLKSFSNSTPLPGATIVFRHWLEQTAEGLNITHQATLSGEAWQGYADRMGVHLEHGLAVVVKKLAHLLEAADTEVGVGLSL